MRWQPCRPVRGMVGVAVETLGLRSAEPAAFALREWQRLPPFPSTRPSNRNTYFQKTVLQNRSALTHNCAPKSHLTDAKSAAATMHGARSVTGDITLAHHPQQCHRIAQWPSLHTPLSQPQPSRCARASRSSPLYVAGSNTPHHPISHPLLISPSLSSPSSLLQPLPILSLFPPSPLYSSRSSHYYLLPFTTHPPHHRPHHTRPPHATATSSRTATRTSRRKARPTSSPASTRTRSPAPSVTAPARSSPRS